jgi:NAD(P)-dependent dehydrogenase (short-subunit alcohol dehydrogenase family)
VLPVITDVSDARAVDALATRTIDHFGRVDLIVNNAGIATGGIRPLWRTDPQDWQRVLAVNVLGVLHTVQVFVPHLVQARAGHVVNIASLAGLTALPGGGAYLVSKHAVVAFSEMLRGELEQTGLPIGVTVACPGLVRTPLTERLFTLPQTDDAVLAEHSPAALSGDQRRAKRQRFIATSMEPQVAAERILAAVEADRLYALTHGDFEDNARKRAAGILAALGNPG